MLRRLATTVRTGDPAQVTSTEGGQPEVDPRDVGLSERDVDAIWRAVVLLYRTGLHPSLALCVRRRGAVVIDRAIGHRRGNAPNDPLDKPKELATPQTLFCMFSASKMVTAMLIHLLDQRGLLHLDDKVAHYIPEFGRHGKEWITIRHVLTHRSGIPTLAHADTHIDALTDPVHILQLLCDARPASVPGRRLAYHALTGGFVLGELVERITGKPIRTFLHDEVLVPLGFRGFNYGVPDDALARVAQNARTGPPLVPPLSTLFRRSLGVDLGDAVRWSNDRRYQTAVVPAGNIYATADEASRFMQLMLQGGELDGVRVFEPRTIQRAVAETSYLEVDLTLGFPVRYGMGFMLGADYLSLYGMRTAHAFGHLGFTNVVLWADPARDISVALMTAGKPVVSAGQLAWINVMHTISRRCPRDWGH